MGAATLMKPDTSELRLRLGGDYVVHQVSTAPPRVCRPEEIPLIDLANIDGDLSQRENIAVEVRHAAEKLGFFYIKNHGIGEQVIKKAEAQALRFFRQPQKLKEPATKYMSKFANNGWSPPRTTTINPGEGSDLKEGFGWSYSPHFDPQHEGHDLAADILTERNTDEPHLWSSTSHLEGFKNDTLAYWSSCLTLARKLNRVFALSLSLPEDYFDNVTTYPGADGVYNFYPALTPDQLKSSAPDVGIGSHTDFQCFTLLWQDKSGGLQILSRESEWIWAMPIEGTFVVNIGDFLSRLTNDRYKSTIHRACNRRSDRDRLSMPFFFGFNYDSQCAVLPSCIDEKHPAKYEPITCGQWREIRFGRCTSESGKMKEA
ncbi:2OG-Fe(II) oxygenase superfamily protein [Xylariales sp. AK1849]|nr:2OG-Fe(II) oxygenase superfamily protein [Xylariales sp. AK1849]